MAKIMDLTPCELKEIFSFRKHVCEASQGYRTMEMNELYLTMNVVRFSGNDSFSRFLK